MTDKEFMNFVEELNEYLSTEKIFIKNRKRFDEVKQATEIANELFADAKISVVDDALQLGSLVLRIEGFDIVARGEREIVLFTQLISKADNFEIYPIGDEKIMFAVMFNNALIKVPQGK